MQMQVNPNQLIEMIKSGTFNENLLTDINPNMKDIAQS